jgi:N-hydroxyarylamine O-acetyltransferase
MFLTVPLNGQRFVVDPGFGPYASPVPVPLVEAAEAGADHDTHWMVRDGDLWVLRGQKGDKPVDAWVTTLEHENRVDFEVANHFIATHPASPFVSWVMMSAVTGDGRVNVMNRDLTIVRGNERRSAQLADRAALRALLVEHFGFDLPEVEQLRVPAIPEWE